MAELEQALAALELDWPATPPFDLRRPPHRRWPFAVAAIAVAVGVAFAVPPARSAILRFFHLRGVSIERVTTLPPAQQRSLAATLGTPISAARARILLGRPFGLDARLYRTGDSVSALLAGPVLVTELRVGAPGDVVLKKLVAGETQTVAVDVAGNAGVWIAGEPHAFRLPPSPRRLAGNVLLVARGDVLYRLEGKHLTRTQALAEARLLLSSG